jgi:hypothetical protein
MRRAAAILASCLAASAAIGQEPDLFPVTLEVELSHDKAVAGQAVWGSWSVVKGAEVVTSCRRMTAFDEATPSSPRSTQKAVTGLKLTVPTLAKSSYWLTVECFYPDPTGELDPTGAVRKVSVVVPARLSITTREAIAGQPPSCYPGPVGSGSRPYATTFKDPEGMPVTCALWMCDRSARYLCFRWSTADLSVSALLAAGAKAELDAKWVSAPWTALSKLELAKLQELEAQAVAELPPPPSWRVAVNQNYSTRPVYRTGPTGELVNATDRRVAVGAPCNCEVRFRTSSYCSVEGVENALKPPATLPADSFAICALTTP